MYVILNQDTRFEDKQWKKVLIGVIHASFGSHTGAFTPSVRNFDSRCVNTDVSLDNNIPVGLGSPLRCQRPHRSVRWIFFDAIS